MTGNVHDLLAGDDPIEIVPLDPIYTVAIIWPLAVIVAVGLVLVVVLMMGPRLFRDRRLASAAIRCPVQDRAVAVEFVEAVWDGRRVDVSRCSIFEPSTAVRCDKRCVDVDELTERGWPGSIHAPRPLLPGGRQALHRGDEW